MAESSQYSPITSPTLPPTSPTTAISPDPNISQPISETFSLHDNNSIQLQRIDSEQQEIKQTAVNALHQNSILTMHVIASGEVT
jgi:hypothetical protein